VRHRLLRLVAAFGLLVTVACGARLNAEQTAIARAGGGGGGGGGTATKSAASAGPAASGAAAANGGGGAAAGTANASGAAAAGGGAAAAGACTAQPGSTDPGVSDTEIKLGNVSTITGPVQGFGETGRSGAKAYFNYINSTQNGVCGRKLSLETADDRLDAGANRSETERLIPQVLGFVGDTTVVDDGGAGALAGTNIANVSLAIGSEMLKYPNNFSPNPIDPSVNSNGTVGIWNWFKANMGITKVAVVWPAQADARTRGQAYVADIEAAGLQVAGPYEVAISETNYVGVATKMKNDGADAVITVLEISGMKNLADAFAQISWKPKVPFYGAQAYGQQFLDLAGQNADGTVLALTYAIFEDAPSNPGVATFLEWYERTNPGSQPDFFSVMGWSAADLMVQALQAAGPTPTRDKVLAGLQALTSFDAHGLLAPRNPPAKQIGPGFLVVTVEGGKWKRVSPAQGFTNG
jgi:ABC-type branched-subunit amino acid transport system substrate-binding protein